MMTIGITTLGGLLAMSQLQVLSGTGFVMGKVGDTIGSFAAPKADSNAQITCRPSIAGSSTTLAWGVFAASKISGWEPHTSGDSAPLGAGCKLENVPYAKANFPVTIRSSESLEVVDVQEWTSYIQFRQDTGASMICGKASYTSSKYGAFTCELPPNMNA